MAGYIKDGVLYGVYGSIGERDLILNRVNGVNVVKNPNASLLEVISYTLSKDEVYALGRVYPSSREKGLTASGSYPPGTGSSGFSQDLSYRKQVTPNSNIGGVSVSIDGVEIQGLAADKSNYFSCTQNKGKYNGYYLTTSGEKVFNNQTSNELGLYDNQVFKGSRSYDLIIKLYSAPPYLIEVNSAPVISGEDTNLGEKNQPFEIQYSVEDKDITDNVTVTEHLNNSLIRRITNANNTEQTLKITSELLNSCPLGETNTIKIYAEDEKGAGTYRNYWFKRTNTPPYFVEENQDLGTVTKAPTIKFTAKDDDGDKYLKAKVKINQRVVKTYDQLGNGEQVSFTLDWKDFMQLHHSRKHNLWVEVEDSSGALATLKYTFERDTKKIEIVTNTAPLDIKIKLIVFNANIKLGEGATFLQYACNDFGTKNTWEKIENGVPHEFANKHEGKDVIGYKCELIKGTGESEIRSIGGSFI